MLLSKNHRVSFIYTLVSTHQPKSFMTNQGTLDPTIQEAVQKTALAK
jgi:hypothetical protein